MTKRFHVSRELGAKNGIGKKDNTLARTLAHHSQFTLICVDMLSLQAAQLRHSEPCCR